MRPWIRTAQLLSAAALALSACKGAPKKYTTTVQVMQVRTFGGASGGAKLTDLELKFVECPGNARQIMRAPKQFSDCGTKLKAGDKLKAEVELSYNPERGVYRSEITRLGACDVKVDPKDEANYRTVENCTDVLASGMTVGVRCDLGRPPALVAACPWFRR